MALLLFKQSKCADVYRRDK